MPGFLFISHKSKNIRAIKSPYFLKKTVRRGRESDLIVQIKDFDVGYWL
ncbi:hypothetical protein RD1_1017 [Roseobacter denitrificans OCh 114]|uniref:Uncharacterized protein n=1 Tax=Roseobacter denitrificans (strain ATCC 33942 / OCh 114) TaxID=375451 RepID=Q16BG1_ROSDO|nr:hypothetical protein RD1_1017 [Roseobacter denitrificans OCh 114]